jgi:HSP20 family protein
MSLLPMWRREEKNPIGSLQGEMNRLFEEFFGGRSLAPWRGFAGDGQEFMPAVDIRETDDKVVVEAELPGVYPKEVDIRLEGDVLVISGERKHEREHKTKGFLRVERSFGRFERALELPHGCDPEKVEAAFKEGVLTIEIAKKEEAKRRTIQVKVK